MPPALPLVCHTVLQGCSMIVLVQCSAVAAVSVLKRTAACETCMGKKAWHGECSLQGSLFHSMFCSLFSLQKVADTCIIQGCEAEHQPDGLATPPGPPQGLHSTQGSHKLNFRSVCAAHRKYCHWWVTHVISTAEQCDDQNKHHCTRSHWQIKQTHCISKPQSS